LRIIPRHGQQADAAIARVEDHPAMALQCFQRALLPTGPLVVEAVEFSGCFGPADNIGHEVDPVVALLIAHVAVHADHQFEVLAHGIVAISPHFDERGAAEQAERARDEHQRVHMRIGDAVHQEGAQIFHHLEAGDHGVGNADLLQRTAANGAAIGYADGPADRDQPPVVIHEGLGCAQQPVGFDDRIGVDDAHQRRARKADPGVCGIGLAAVLLVHDEQVRVPTRMESPVDLRNL
jgi:hypothetical protein